MKHIAPEALIYEFLVEERYPDSGTTVKLNVEKLYKKLEKLCQACNVKEQDARRLFEKDKE